MENQYWTNYIHYKNQFTHITKINSVITCYLAWRRCHNIFMNWYSVSYCYALLALWSPLIIQTTNLPPAAGWPITLTPSWIMWMTLPRTNSVTTVTTHQRAQSHNMHQHELATRICCLRDNNTISINRFINNYRSLSSLEPSWSRGSSPNKVNLQDQAGS